MATARERLLQALEAILSQNLTNEGKTSLKRLLNTYRVQSKPGEKSIKDQTARDLLFDTLAGSWAQGVALDRPTISHLISPFRMQLKQGLGRAKFREPFGEKSYLADTDDMAPGATKKTRLKENYARIENAYFSDKNKGSPIRESAIAGGPAKKSRQRGQCPKCRSFGVVLAKAYGGEDYYSCIYCGYQAYIKSSDSKFDLPYAAELLENAFGETEPEGEE